MPPVQHLQLLLYVLLLASGFAGITVTAILLHRTRNRLLLIVLVIISLFSAGLLFFLALFYVNEIIIYPLRLERVMSYVNTALITAVYAGMIIFTDRLDAVGRSASAAPRERRPRLATLWLILSVIPVLAAYAVFGVASWSVPPIAQWMASHGDLVNGLSVGAASLFLAVSGRVIMVRARRLAASSIRFFFLQFGRLLFWFAVASAVATGAAITFDWLFDPTTILNFVLYSGLNVTAIVAFVRYLTLPADLLEDGSPPAETLERYGITAREAEVIELLSRGLANKEIADELGISFTTARTHVYNIFRKTGAASRVELLRILSAP
jgi:DNA-binding CsgD family transcriptional regulator